jgi:hypothetical protein
MFLSTFTAIPNPLLPVIQGENIWAMLSGSKQSVAGITGNASVCIFGVYHKLLPRGFEHMVPIFFVARWIFAEATVHNNSAHIAGSRGTTSCLCLKGLDFCRFDVEWV